MTRAITLRELAASDLAFYGDRGLVPPTQLRPARAALDSLDRYLARARPALLERADRNVGLLADELAETRRELRRTRAALARTEEPSQATQLASRTNLLDLARARLERLVADATAARSYLDGVDGYA